MAHNLNATCSNCPYWQRAVTGWFDDGILFGWCKREPRQIKKRYFDWCGCHPDFNVRDVKNPNIEEEKKVFIVGLYCGGTVEEPDITIKDVQEIVANNCKEAVDLYNAKNKCNHYYGVCFGEKTF